jgi:hypothetical protein
LQEYFHVVDIVFVQSSPKVKLFDGQKYALSQNPIQKAKYPHNC